MVKYRLIRTFILAIIIISFVCVFSSCGTDPTTPTASSTPAPGSTSTPSAIPTVAPDLTGNYAFTRNGQLWVALHGGAPVQATHFDYSGVIDGSMPVFFNHLLWFDNDTYLSFQVRILKGNVGGGGCGFNVNFGSPSALYVLNVKTMNLQAIKVAGDTSDDEVLIGGHWVYTFAEDATHLLAWLGSATGSTAQAGLYRYDLTAGSFKLVIPESSVPNANNPESWSAMRYSHGKLYYETRVATAGDDKYTFTIYSHSVINPEQASVKILDAGSELFCHGDLGPDQVSGQFVDPGWDVSADGTKLVAQTISGTDVKALQGKIQLVNLINGTQSTIAQNVPPPIANQDLKVSLSPDGKQLLLVQFYANGDGHTFTAYSVNLVSGDHLNYTISPDGPYTNEITQILWHQSSSAFVLDNSYLFTGYGSTPMQNDAQLFTVGKADPSTLLANALNFSWG
ncbi:hypothetical protein [Tengunoibacter tsumagoiensis]|uniref:Lipoprotein n=1 Tax=Tengunoibacter tsumagoiensis TaxID=2014871 RepID=A0A401ZV18_9CHLR|nr:hypothetical protein [Tengunoibacter tsumagoiensis]GCE10636.1 hypothetical protein KTT_04950 [Tengunoibacter tsumagoiensis]